MDQKNKISDNTANGIQQVYESKVGAEALARAGKIDGAKLKGIVHEVLFKDKLNIANLLDGKSAVLTRSTTAIRDDVVVKSAGRVVGRFQLKDAPSSLSKVIKQVKEGKYARTKLVGTVEVAEKYAAAGKNVQKMSSSGISTQTTERIANKALGKMGSVKSILSGTGRAGVIGAVIGCGVSAVMSVGDLIDGNIDKAEFAGRVAKSGVAAGASSAGGAVAASVASAATGTVITATGIGGAVTAGSTAALVVTFAPVVVATAAAIFVGGLVSDLFGSLFD